MKKLLCYLALLFAFNAYADESQALIDYAHRIAVADGHKHPKYVIGVIRVESDAGRGKSFRVVKQDKSVFYGIGQLTIGAAHAVMKRFPELWSDFNTRTDEELKARLILDDRFNIQIISKYLLILGINSNAERGIAAYNVGLGGVESIDYRRHVYTLKVIRAAQLPSASS